MKLDAKIEEKKGELSKIEQELKKTKKSEK